MSHTSTLKAVALRSGFMPRAFATLSAALMRRRERAMLARLDLHLLRDIGLDPVEATAEVEKPCWRA